MNGSQMKWCLGLSTFGNLVLNAGTNNIQSLTVGGKGSGVRFRNSLLCGN